MKKLILFIYLLPLLSIAQDNCNCKCWLYLKKNKNKDYSPFYDSSNVFGNSLYIASSDRGYFSFKMEKTNNSKNIIFTINSSSSFKTLPNIFKGQKLLFSFDSLNYNMEVTDIIFENEYSTQLQDNKNTSFKIGLSDSLEQMFLNRKLNYIFLDNSENTNIKKTIQYNSTHKDSREFFKRYFCCFNSEIQMVKKTSKLSSESILANAKKNEKKENKRTILKATGNLLLGTAIILVLIQIIKG